MVSFMASTCPILFVNLKHFSIYLIFTDIYNRPDPSGAQLHRRQYAGFYSQFTGPWPKTREDVQPYLDDVSLQKRQIRLFHCAPLLFTAEIYQAESARIRDRLPTQKLMWLGKQLISLTNERLSSRKTACDLECVGVLSILVLDAYIINDRDKVYKFAKGLLTILDIMGEAASFRQHPGLKALVALALLLSGLMPRTGTKRGVGITAISSSRIRYNHLLSGDQNRFENSAAGSPLRQSIYHKLRLALQPVSSGLSELQLRNFLVDSFMGPLQNFLFALVALFDTAENFYDNIVAKEQAQLTITSILAYFNESQAYLDDDQLPTSTFSQQDATRYYWILACLSLCGRILTLHTLYLVSPTSAIFKEFSNLILVF